MTGKNPAPSDADIDAALAKVGVAAPDDKTFTVTLTHPTGYFLDSSTLWSTAPMQKKWVETPNFTEAANYVSSGPFMMKDLDPPGRDRPRPEPELVRRPSRPSRNSTMQIGGDPDGEPGLVRGRRARHAGGQPAGRAADQGRRGPWPARHDAADPDLRLLGLLDATKGPTANKHFRRALSMAIDKDTMMATVYGGQGVVAGSPIPPGMPGHQADIGLKYDVTAAKAELATALTELGYSDVSELPTLSFGFNTDAGHDIPAAYMQEQWSKNLGVKSELKGETFDQFVVDRPKSVFSIARNAWGADYPHPDNFLRVLFQSESGNNDEGYNNPEFDKLIDQAGAEPDVDKALALYNQAQELLVDDAPAVFTRWRITNYEVRPWVKGVAGTAQDSVVIGDYFYENIQIAKH